MNIAYYSHYFTPEIGAPSARIYDLAQEWLRGGHRVQVATCFPNHPKGELYPGYRRQLYAHELLDGIDVHRHWTYVTPNKGFLKKSLGHVSLWPSSVLYARKLKPVPDVFIGTSPTFFAAMAAARVAKTRKRPFIMEVRDLWPALFIELGVMKNRTMIRLLEKLELSLYRRAARVVTVTEAFRQNLIERGVPERKVVTIPNGANVDFWTERGEGGALRAKLGLEGKFVALYIGAHGISQALTSLLQTAARLREEPDFQLVLVGEGAEKEKLQHFASDQKLTNVTFIDPVGKDEVRAFYSLADVCLVPLRDIPLFSTFIPSKMFEILSMGRPIAGSLRGEPAAILERSGGALIVEPENDAQLASAIVTLMRDPARRAAMGESGRRFVVDHYSRAALAKTYLETMHGAIADFANQR
ncbi:MAG TPA: glycosyltransferase family 4 protein [Thermoanaerobaculia bacterium]